MKNQKMIRRMGALLLSAVLLVPQTSVGTYAAVQSKKTEAAVKALKTGPQVTKIVAEPSWSGVLETVGFPEIEHYSEYENAITSVSVNGTEYVKDWNDEDSSLVYEFSYFDGLKVYLGAFTDGVNTVVITADGYAKKTIHVLKSGDTYTFVDQTDEGGNAGTETPSVETDSTESPKPSSTPGTTDTPGIANPTEDGEYTVSFKAYKEGSEEESMLGGFFAPRVKLTVKNGAMKLSMLNTLYASAMLDFSIATDGTFAEAVKTANGDAANEYTMDITTLAGRHQVAALVTMMGGSAEDKGDYSKYTKADLVFTSIEKGWKGYVKTGKEALVDALIERGYDTDEDGTISVEEIQNISEELNLSNCNLTDVSMLKDLTDKVTSIDLSENDLVEIPEGLFDNMTNLQYVYLNTNKLISLPKDLFKNNKHIEWINLRANNLTSVSQDDFSGLAELKYLELDNNDIITIEAGALDGDTGLQQIGLSGNMLRALPDKLFAEKKALDFINIADNQFETLPECINDAKALRKLIAYNNLLTDITAVDYSQMENLAEVNFMKNYIESVPAGTFAKNKKMLCIDFHDNQLTNVSGDAFPDELDNGRDDGKLQKLDITLNNIRVVDPALMKKCDVSINKFYPQKTALSMKLEKTGDKELTLQQELSMLDLVYWYDTTASDEKRELETVEDYKNMLEQNGLADKTIDEIMSEKYDWEIVTTLQKKNADGSWSDVSETESGKEAEPLKTAFELEESGIYRVVKQVSTTLNGMMQYRFTACSAECNTETQNPAVPTETPAASAAPAVTPEPTKAPSDNQQVTVPQETPKTTASKAKAVKLAKVKKLSITRKKKSAKLSWKSVKKADGYQVYRAASQKGKYKLVKKTKGVSFVDKKAKSGKTYYYKVRAYKKTEAGTVYSAFSAVKKAKGKK